jgi:AcrR family transcriptional regulator
MTTHKTKEERRSQILDAAITCFAEKGYYETSMDDIVRAAGLSKGSLYWYFPGKRDLFRTLTESWMVEILTGLPERLAACKSASEKLFTLLSASRDSVAARPELARAQLVFMAQAVRDPEIRDWFRQTHRAQRTFLAQIIEEGIASGEFRPLPADAVAGLIMAYGDGSWLHRELRGTGDDIGILIDEMKSTLLAILKA